MYADMKTDLMEYLGNFARQGKVVKEEDIRNFFQVEFLLCGLGSGYIFFDVFLSSAIRIRFSTENFLSTLPQAKKFTVVRFFIMGRNEDVKPITPWFLGQIESFWFGISEPQFYMKNPDLIYYKNTYLSLYSDEEVSQADETGPTSPWFLQIDSGVYIFHGNCKNPQTHSRAS